MLLKKKICQFGLAAIVFACGSFFAASAALAQTPPPEDLVVEFEQTPLFGNEEDNFLPGDSVIRWVKVTNNTEQVQKIATEAINYFGFPDSDDVPDKDLSRALLITIHKKDGGDIYYGGGDKTLFDFYENGETYLSDIAAASGGVGSINEYEFIISFPANKGDKWQRTTTKFDIIVGFQEEDGGGIITPPSGGGGGSISGLIIKNEGVIILSITETTATIEWWTSYEATSRVIYCEASDVDCALNLNDPTKDLTFNLPLYGYNYTTDEMHTPANPNGVTYRKITIAGLTAETTYDFRCISHASPPTVSRSHTFTTLALADNGGENGDGEDTHTPNPSQEENKPISVPSQEEDNSGASRTYSGIGGVINAASDFMNSILGNEEEEKQKGEIAGTTDENDAEIGSETESKVANECGKYPEYLLWLIALLLLIIIALLYYIYKNKKGTQRINNAQK